MNEYQRPIKKPTTVFSVRLTLEIIHEIERARAKSGLSRTQFINEVFKLFLSKQK